VTATAQLLNDVVERWVREDPGQWMWFHKRWGLSKRDRRRRKKPSSNSGRP
jgi:KDO2-lipid IV(A) lauroyltransferase